MDKMANVGTLTKRVGGGGSSLRPVIVMSAVVVGMYLAREVLIPFAFAVVLSLIWTPAVNWLQKLHIRRAPAVFIVVLASLGVGGYVGWVIANQLIAVLNELPDYQQNIHDKMAALRSPGTGSLGRAAESVERLNKELLTPESAPKTEGERRTAGTRSPNLRNNSSGSAPVPVQVIEKPTNTFDYLTGLARQFVAPAGIAGIVLIFSIFLLIERQDVRNRLLRLVGLGQLNVMTQALDDATKRVSRYLLLQFAVNAGFGLSVGVGLYFIGLPYAALWGTVAGVLRIVPYAGTVIAGVLPLLLSFAVFNTWSQPVLVFLLIASLELVVGNWVEPRLYGAHIGVSSLAILVTTIFWTVLWGPAGLILSTPLTVCVAVLGRYVPQFSFLHVLLGDEPVLTTDAQVYQRLLAFDREEAQDVADHFLKEHSLVDLYDGVFVPALALAEQDRHKGALDLAREQFIFLSIREMIEELSDYKDADQPPVEECNDEPPAPEFGGRVLCLPSHDEADEIVAAMLAQLLEAQGIPAIAFPVGDASFETLTLLAPHAPDVICISALPPFALAHTRTAARRMKYKFPTCKLVVAVWGFNGDVVKALERFQEPRPDRVIVSLADAVSHFTGRIVPGRLVELRS